MTEQILIVEDEFIVANDLRLTLEKAGYRVCGIAASVEEARKLISQHKPQLVLLDIYLRGNGTGIDLAWQLKEQNIAFVYLSANSNQRVLEAAKLTEPYGFLVKPFRAKDVLITLDIARYRHQHNLEWRQRREVLQEQLTAQQKNSTAEQGRANAGFEGIIGNSQQLLSVLDHIAQVATFDTSVLIMGESGTGKERIAHCIHHLSHRRTKPFIKVNCAALPASLIESELFGHEKGAFTGATDRRIGKFEQAADGTIFLDEIGEMPLELQVKLLRVLQEKEIERIGGKAPFKVNVRIVAATNRNLEKEVAEGRFRLDLYYRLNIFPVVLPPLRERKEDISLLANHFAVACSNRNNRSFQGIAPKMMAELEAWHWPGNIRELENVIEQSVILCDNGSPLELKRPLSNGALINTATVTTPQHHTTAKSLTDIRKIQEDTEREYIMAILRKTNGRIRGEGGAAQLLNLKPTTLESKMHKLGIKKEDL
ncbi:sigma-54-dependent Fis family transcriptional regulator [Pseudoflavitalea sp. X16]|uniref:sigma-54-dependent transcriptional regulator n=1 Tax=Paraflavitalea devenefica TaxID=2716334 RepID=UPI00141ED7EF|nr:sigma-54 dependent transcriptional regulator [Paraflavitalea devenefica]NII23812.1 sigma-54-dependent Fis family transcriptional regulator [Paraflavitalea devenefica]